MEIVAVHRKWGFFAFSNSYDVSVALGLTLIPCRR